MTAKQKLYNRCVQIVDEKIAIADKLMKDAQESANNEEKSTAGDKFDTARSMSQIERNMYAKQLTEAGFLKKALINLSYKNVAEEIEAGSLVSTPSGDFFISIGLGQIVVDSKDYLVISPISPIGQLLLDKKVGDIFSFNGKENKILKIS